MKKVCGYVIGLFLILAMVCHVQASSYKFTATPSKTTVKPGDEVTISLKVQDIDAGMEGINVVETSLVYDTAVFDKFEIVDKNEWTSTYNNNSGERYGKLLFKKMVTGVKDDEVIGVLKFKLKEKLDITETKIKLLQVTSNDGYELLNEGDRIITLKIVKEDNQNPGDEPSKDPADEPNKEPSDEPNKEPDNKPSKEPNDEPNEPEQTPKPTPDQDPAPDNTPKPTQDQKPTGIVPDKIFGVQTGDVIIYVIILLAVIIVANIIIFVYLKNKKNKLNKKQ